MNPVPLRHTRPVPAAISTLVLERAAIAVLHGRLSHLFHAVGVLAGIRRRRSARHPAR